MRCSKIRTHQMCKYSLIHFTKKNRKANKLNQPIILLLRVEIHAFVNFFGDVKFQIR